MTKKLFSILGIGLGVTLSTAFATSVTVTPGAPAVAPGSNSSVTGTVLATFTGSGSNPSNSAVSASVTEYVVRDGSGNIDFFYEVTNSSTNGDNFNTVGVDNYTGVSSNGVMVANNTGTISGHSAGSITANLASRDGGGDTVNFLFTNGQFTPGSTDWLEVDTNQTGYTSVGAFTETIDGGVIQINGGYGPSPTPEPATLGLLGGGLALLGIARWRKARKA
jgi:hypothetical protein